MSAILRSIMVGLAALVAVPALAQDYPSQPVRIIAPFSPGSATDIWARTLADRLGPQLGQPIIVENRAGAAGQIGTEHVFNSEADGYTLLIGTPVNSIGASLYDDLPYSFPDDFEPIVLLATYPLVLVTAPDHEAQTLEDIVVQARENPGSVSYGSSGTGSSQHLTSELLAMIAGLDLIHIPYSGSAASHPDVMSQRVTMIFDNVLAARPAVESGQLKAIMIASDQRTPVLADVPTAEEAGYPDLIASSWVSVWAPKGTPQNILDKLNVEINKVLADEAQMARFTSQGAVIHGGEVDVLVNFVDADIARWAEVIETAQITPDN